MASGGAVDIGIIGGVGHTPLDLAGMAELDVPTPYGPTSTPIRVGTLGGRRVAYLVRRGVDDLLQPHLVPYRANVWALASLGVSTLITTTAAGGLRDTFAPGMFVVADQLIDRTSGRPFTFYDDGTTAVQLAAPEPFDPTLRGLAVEALEGQHVRFRDFGTAVVINGPRFSTRAESHWHAAAGGDLVVSTLMPETTLALELGIGVVNVSFITDSDAGAGSGHTDAVSTDLVRRRIAQARPVLIRTVTEIARTVPAQFRTPPGVPADAIASVLAREPV